MHKLEVIGFGSTPTGEAPLVLLRVDEGERVVPIAIGPLELVAIASPLGGMTPARPLTHDLLATILDELETTVAQVEISDLYEGTYHARLTLLTPAGEELDIDTRPSDAIALAVRTGAPIFASDQVIEDGSVDLTPEPLPDELVDQFRDFLDGVSPADFAPEDDAVDGS